jgi:hypothetical protein
MGILGRTPVSAAPYSPAVASTQAATAPHMMPFLSQKPGLRAAHGKLPLRRVGSLVVTLRGKSDASGAAMNGAATNGSPASAPRRAANPPTTPVPPDTLLGFAGTAQASNIQSFGADQEVTPPNEDIAVGPYELVEVVNSTIVILSRSGAILGSEDLNAFMDVASGHHSSDPRVIYDVETEHFWVTVTEIPDSGCAAAPVLIAVSANAIPLPFTGWRVYALPIARSGSTFGDQPGLGAARDTVTVTFNDFSCGLQFLGSEIDILQKSDLATNTGAHKDDVFIGLQFAPQPVESYLGFNESYVITNESDCGAIACASPVTEVDGFQGTPEGGGVFVQQYFVAMTPTAVSNTGLLPPADQPSPGPQLQTNDDRFLNAVETANGYIWTADGTSCQPPGDTVQRACLNYLEINVGNGTSIPTLTLQLNNVGVAGADLFYPAVSVDLGGNLFTVFDESSTSVYPSIMDSAIPMGGSTLASFQILHTSSTYYNGNALFPGACGTEGCRWGDYSGAVQDQGANENDVWVVSGSEDNTVEGACAAHACWNTQIYQLTLSGAAMSTVSPGFVPLAGGTTMTVTGHDFAADTTLTITDTFTTVSAAIQILSPQAFTFVTPPTFSTSPTGGVVFINATDSLGTSTRTYSYVGLANFVPVTPFRLLDTRAPGGGGALGPGEIRLVQVSGVGPRPLPQNATAYVLNVTEVDGTAASLLTVYPAGEAQPTASNLNFAAHTVIANLATVTTGGSGEVNIYNGLGSVNVVVDVEGYFAPQPATVHVGLFHPILPVRVCDTRKSCEGHVAVGAGQSIVVTVGSVGGIPGDGTAEAAVVNLTGVAGNASTYLSVFPTDQNGHCSPTGTSTMNLLPGVVRANRAMVELGPTSTGGPDDALCVYNAVGTINVLVDANGWYGSSTALATPVGYQYQALEPIRICDTRIASTSCAAGAIGAGTLQRLITVAGHAGVPAFTSSTTVVAIIANLTAIAPNTATYLTLYPASQSSPPVVSDVNLGAGAVVPNLGVVEVDTIPSDSHDGEVYLYNGAGSVNAIIDLEGWFQ